jgi:hypothetical protein
MKAMTSRAVAVELADEEPVEGEIKDWVYM